MESEESSWRFGAFMIGFMALLRQVFRDSFSCEVVQEGLDRGGPEKFSQGAFRQGGRGAPLAGGVPAALSPDSP